MYEKYYENQSGGGTEFSPMYMVPTSQRGGGLGGFLIGLSRTIFPFIRGALKPVGREILNSGINVLGDVLTKRATFRDSVENRMTESGNVLKRKAMERLDKLLHRGGGSVYKPKRVRKSDQKGSGRGRRQVKKRKPRAKTKKPRVKTKSKKKRTKKSKPKKVKRRKKKQVKRDLYDVFS